jgi:ABC-type antimicrobial peptide transport system permease subunit
MLKALGARNSDLYFTVLAQAMLSVLLGFLSGWGITWLLTLLIPLTDMALTMVIDPISLIKVGIASLMLAGLSSMIPIQQIADLDPAMVFRGK